MLVSIGTPAKGQQLVEHLEFTNGENYLFVDPDNAIYDALNLNFGVGSTFFNINTPYGFLDRLRKPNGMQDLLSILSKWSKAFFIPPKGDQAFNQGGTFVFDGERPVYAHYDPSPAAHATVENVMEIVNKELAASDATTSSGSKTIA